MKAIDSVDGIGLQYPSVDHRFRTGKDLFPWLKQEHSSTRHVLSISKKMFGEDHPDGGMPIVSARVHYVFRLRCKG